MSKYCQKHGSHRCQKCADEVLALGIQCDKDRIATLTAEVARLTGELSEAQRQRLPEGYITIPGEAWDAQMKIEGELERSRQECEGLREALASLIGATRHLNPCPGTMEQALAALSASGRER